MLLYVTLVASSLAESPGRLAGTWRFTGPSAEVAALDTKRAEVAGRFNFAIRPIVRQRLKGPMAVDQTITIDGSETTVSLAFTGAVARSGEGPSDGSVKYAEGGVKTSYLVRDATLTSTGSSPDGGRTNELRLLNDDRLQLTSTLWSDQLGEPVSWTLTYSRVK